MQSSGYPALGNSAWRHWASLGIPPPCPGGIPVTIPSDSQGHFGHRCPICQGYWRSGPWPNACPYCAERAEGFQFMSQAQLDYVRHYCAVFAQGIETVENGDVLIDMDAVAAAAGKDGPKPPFYVAEQSQQHKFRCSACGEFNDVLGRFAYCSSCATRNDLQAFSRERCTRHSREPEGWTRASRSGQEHSQRVRFVRRAVCKAIGRASPNDSRKGVSTKQAALSQSSTMFTKHF